MKLSLEDGRISFRFAYDPALVDRVRRLPGARWDASSRAWRFPLELKVARQLKEEFGPALQIDVGLRTWSKSAARREYRQRVRATAQEARLANVNDELAAYLKPYQRADVAYMASHSVVNANEAGLGKTTEVIAAVHELNRRDLPVLVVSPITSLEAVWRPTIERLDGGLVFTGTTPIQRTKAMQNAESHLMDAESGGWVCINPEYLKTPAMTWAAKRHWAAIVVDEFHTMGLTNPKSLLFHSIGKLRAERFWPLSGSPMGGVPLNLWPVLHWIDPQAFPSRWRWANQWLETKTSPFGTTFGDVKVGRKSEFYRYHAPWLLRRLKSEVLPELSPKTYRDVWVSMRPAQVRQYRQFECDAELRLNGQSLIGASRLTEYTWLKFFAFGSMTMDSGGMITPTPKSPKLEALRVRIERHAGQSQLVFSQSRRIAELVARELGAPLLAGGVKNRADIVCEFQNGHHPVLVIVTKAAGVSVTLHRADVVHILDQTWNPEDQSQAEDRAHRIGQTKNVTVYYYRTRGTIEETIAQLNLDKQRVNTEILDQHRAFLIRNRP